MPKNNFLLLMKNVMIIFFLLFAANSFGQQTITKYFSDLGDEVPQGKAKYYAEFTPKGSGYDYIAYWPGTDRIRQKGVRSDTTSRADFIGLSVSYYKNGKMEDSILNEPEGVRFFYHYYKNGKLNASFVKDESTGTETIEGFDESGDKIKDFVFLKEASFKGGPEGWTKYITKKGRLPKSVVQDMLGEKIDENFATVEVMFIVNEEGGVENARIRKSSGYRPIDNYALEVIEKSPKWNPAVQYNEPVKAYKIQPFTYLLK